MPEFIKCKACGEVISKKAATCPKCGHPMKKQRSTIGFGGAIAIIFLVLVAAIVYQGGTGTLGISSPNPDSSTPGQRNASKDVTMGGEFPTLESCLETIKSKAGPLEMTIDKPEEVTGITAERKLFSCKKEVTGTKGTYFEGWYITDEKSN